MSSNSVINFKVFLRDGNTCEARRFAVDAGVVTSFLFMKEKLQSLIPQLKETEYKLSWKDADGDEITIASDEDLITAYTEMNSNVKVLYVTVIQRNNENIFGIEIEEPVIDNRNITRVVCDGCEKYITGIRFKCIQCPDFDLCADCEHQGFHTEHLMMRMPHNFSPFPRCSRKSVANIIRSLHKSCPMGRGSFRGRKHHDHHHHNKSENQPSTSEKQENKCHENTQSSECPFTENFDLGQLASLAQHFGPFLEAFTQPKSNQSNDANAINTDTLSDLIKNAVDGFFGRSQPNDNNNGGAQTQSQATPMDVEQPHQKEGQNNDEKRREPGWTFVSPQQVDQPTSSTAQQTNATAPIIIPDEPQYGEALKQLKEMGFSNENNRLTRLLEKYNGNVSKVIKAIFEMSIQ